MSLQEKVQALWQSLKLPKAVLISYTCGKITKEEVGIILIIQNDNESNPDGAWLSNREIAEATGIDKSKISVTLAKLKSLGFITPTYKYDQPEDPTECGSIMRRLFTSWNYKRK